MALYTIYSDFDHFAIIGFDQRQVIKLCGNTPHGRFDFLGVPKSFKDIITEPLNVNFSDDSDGMAGTKIPDIQVFHGRMFLSKKAYAALNALIKDDGEFFPVCYEKGDGYIFNPLSVAEDVDGLDISLCHKNAWDDIENLGFHEDRVSKFAIFKTAFDTYINFYCRQDIKDAIEQAGLQGLSLTSELGAEFGMSQDQKLAPS